MRGIAAGITGISEQGAPQGLLVFHPGDCDLVRGIVETAVQVLEPVESVEGFKTYRVPDIGFLVVSTRLVLLSDSRNSSWRPWAAYETHKQPAWRRAKNLAELPAKPRVRWRSCSWMANEPWNASRRS